MLRKLLKYDFRSMGKQFALLWPAALVLALVNRFTLPGNGSGFAGETLGFVAAMAYFGVVVALFVITLIFVIQRFYYGLLGGEGYLMHTLPVKPWQLVASKLICAVVTSLISLVVAFLSMFLLMPISWDKLLTTGTFTALRILVTERPDVLLLAVEILLVFVAALSAGILMVYLAMALGHLFPRNRVAGSVLSFLGINIAVNILMSAAATFIPDVNLDQWLTVQQSAHVSMWLMTLCLAAFAAAFFAGTVAILRRKLNLE